MLGALFISHSGEDSIRIQEQRELLTLRGHANFVIGVDFSPDGKRLASASWDRTIQVYALDPRELLKLARGRVTRLFTGRSANATSNPRPARPCLKSVVQTRSRQGFT